VIYVDISHDSKEKKEERKENGVAVGDNLPRLLVWGYQKKRLVHQKKTMDPTLFNP